MYNGKMEKKSISVEKERRIEDRIRFDILNFVFLFFPFLIPLVKQGVGHAHHHVSKMLPQIRLLLLEMHNLMERCIKKYPELDYMSVFFQAQKKVS